MNSCFKDEIKNRYFKLSLSFKRISLLAQLNAIKTPLNHDFNKNSFGSLLSYKDESEYEYLKKLNDIFNL